MGDHVYARSVHAELVDEPPGAVAGVGDDGVEAPVQAPLGATLSGAGLAREDVVGGEHQRAPAGQQRAVEMLHGEPLEVHELVRRGPRGGRPACPGRARPA